MLVYFKISKYVLIFFFSKVLGFTHGGDVLLGCSSKTLLVRRLSTPPSALLRSPAIGTYWGRGGGSLCFVTVLSVKSLNVIGEIMRVSSGLKKFNGF